MIKRIYIIFLLLTLTTTGKAQQHFITSGRISFEKKVNLQRSIVEWDIPQETKDKVKKYRISEWDLTFDKGHSLFKGIKTDEEADGRFFDLSGTIENELYADYEKKTRILKKDIYGDHYLLNDTIPKLDWKIMHDLRNIAGYECRKAIGRINDSVYVVAFYTDEILLKSGPEGFSGLPGMILGLAIPRYFTTWFATKVFPLISLNTSNFKEDNRAKAVT